MVVPSTAQEKNRDKDRAAVEASAFTSFENVEAFVAVFKAAVRERSCFKVAALTELPLRLNCGRANALSAVRMRFVFNRTALCRYFPEIFTEETSRVIENQNLLDMPVGQRGLMFGNGVIWLQPVCSARNSDGTCPDDKYKLRFTAANITPSEK